jgi:FixJ family two-component response regulator
VTAPHDDSLIYVVDDDPAVRESIGFLVSSVGYRHQAFASAQEFLDAWRPGNTACLIADIRLPGMSGLELQRELARRGAPLAVILITGHGDIPMAVHAMRQGAVDFLEKPFTDQVLLDRINEALQLSAEAMKDHARRMERERRLECLTAREREVLELVVAGKTNKAIATHLDISIKTVEAHRAKVMEKAGATSIAELVAWFPPSLG